MLRATAALGGDQFLTAIAKGDAKAFAAMLAENFVHRDYQGNVV